ncbi:hypothetical protein Dimus_032810 [Dionaea muscipula]
MAKRGRPRKRGGLARANVVPRASIAGSASHLWVAEDEGLEADGGRAEFVRAPAVRDGVWAEEEEEDLVENEIVVDPAMRSPYCSALQNVLEENRAITNQDLSPMAGNRDIDKGEKLSRRSRRDEEIVISKEAVSQLEKSTLACKFRSRRAEFAYLAIGVI